MVSIQYQFKIWAANEPITFGSGGGRRDDVSDNSDSELRQDENGRVPSMVPRSLDSQQDVNAPDEILLQITKLWPQLPEPVKTAIRLLIDAVVTVVEPKSDEGI